MDKKQAIENAYKDLGIKKGFTNESMEAMELALENYAEAKCEQQKELCFSVMKHQKFGWYKAKKKDVLEAPKPVFD